MSTFTTFYAELQKLLFKHSEALKRQTNSDAVLGEDREFFIRTVLDRSLPLNITTVRGVIVDSGGKESNPQDVILYRTDFPSIASFVGSRRFLVEGVMACIEVKSHLDQREFKRALNTLKTAHGLKKFGIEVPRNLSKQDRERYIRIVKDSGYTKNQISTHCYIFAYRGITFDTLMKYILSAIKSGISFWELPCVIYVLDRGICLIRDDGQVLSPYPSSGSSQCIYCSMRDKSRTLEFFMLHVLSSCLFTGGMQIYGTPLRFRIFDYMDQPVSVKPIYVNIKEDLSPLKTWWDGRRRVTTNDVLKQYDLAMEGT